MAWLPPVGFERRKGDGKALVFACLSCFLLPTLLLAREVRTITVELSQGQILNQSSADTTRF